MRIGIGNTVPERVSLHGQSGGGVVIPDEFIFEVNAAIGNTIGLTTRNNGAAANFIINWGEGADETVNAATASHTYTSSGTKVVKINKAGTIFLGSFVNEAIGDYIAGPNHVLPTARTASNFRNAGQQDRGFHDDFPTIQQSYYLYNSSDKDITFFHSRKYKDIAKFTKASFCITLDTLKKAKSGFTLESMDIAIIPLIPIKKTIGIIIINESNRLFFKISLFFAAKTLCQFP